MSIIALPNGLWWPSINMEAWGTANTVPKTSITIDATGEKVAFFGYLKVDGRATGKTLSSSGGKISFQANTVTFATAGSTMRVGLQGVSTASGPPQQPDGTWSAYKDLVQGTDTISAAAWNTANIDAGTATLSHGDFVAVVFDFTTRNGADSIQIQGKSCASGVGGASTGASAYTTTWASSAVWPIVVIEFDDGTLATLSFTLPFTTSSSANIYDGSNPDEYGLIFQVPFACQVEGVRWVFPNGNGAVSQDSIVTLYSDPLGTPTAMASVTCYGEHQPTNYVYMSIQNAIALTTLRPNVDYCLAIKASNTGSIYIGQCTLAHENHRKFINGGTTLRRGTRNNSTGAFGSLSTTILPVVDLFITALDDGTGAGRASMNIGV